MKSEKALHAAFEAWLRKLEIPFITTRMDQRSTTASGMPDYCVTFMSRCCYIECKVGRNKLSVAQEKRIAYIRKSGNKVIIAYSLEDCIEAVKNILCDGKPETLLERRGEALGPYDEHDWTGLKQTVREAGTKPLKSPKAKKQPELPVNGKTQTQGWADVILSDGNGHRTESFYIGKWSGTDYVFARDADGAYRHIRQASAADIINFKPLPR